MWRLAEAWLLTWWYGEGGCLVNKQTWQSWGNISTEIPHDSDPSFLFSLALILSFLVPNWSPFDWPVTEGLGHHIHGKDLCPPAYWPEVDQFTCGIWSTRKCLVKEAWSALQRRKGDGTLRAAEDERYIRKWIRRGTKRLVSQAADP